PIPITMWDLELWAKNDVVKNFLPYLKVYKNPSGFIDAILAPLKFGQIDNNVEGSESNEKGDIDEKRCPLFNLEKKECLVYEYRPLSCRTYPLEYDGKTFQIVDLECPGVGEGPMSKAERIEMRDYSKDMHKELVRMRVSLPVLNQVIRADFFVELLKQQQEAMKNMDPEDLKKMDEIFKKK
ncbi:MAG: hypothetical protein GF364_05195, partial [Candidatus Lokiarchaeota archaeon]|nr:hypothetical protein [Candidatus Lokiarchaeota archaeon]